MTAADGKKHTIAIFSLFTLCSGSAEPVWPGQQAEPQEHPKPQCPLPADPSSPGKVWQVFGLSKVTLLLVWVCHIATRGRKTFLFFKQI